MSKIIIKELLKCVAVGAISMVIIGLSIWGISTLCSLLASSHVFMMYIVPGAILTTAALFVGVVVLYAFGLNEVLFERKPKPKQRPIRAIEKKTHLQQASSKLLQPIE